MGLNNTLHRYVCWIEKKGENIMLKKKVIYKEWVVESIRNQRALLLVVCLVLLGWNSCLTYQLNRVEHTMQHIVVPTCSGNKVLSNVPNSEANETNKDLSSFKLTEVPVLK